jgi:hypothetical protein
MTPIPAFSVAELQEASQKMAFPAMAILAHHVGYTSTASLIFPFVPKTFYPKKNTLDTPMVVKPYTCQFSGRQDFLFSCTRTIFFFFCFIWLSTFFSSVCLWLYVSVDGYFLQ